MSGPYPDYEKVIPETEGNVLKIQKDEFLSTLKRISIFTHPPAYIVKFTLSPDEQILEASSPEVGEGIEKLQGEYSGEDIQVGFNSQYLQEIVRHIPSDEIVIHTYEPDSACKIEGVLDQGDIKLFYLLMPVKIE